MATVLRLVVQSNDETVETLQWMLAQALKGNLTGFCGSFRDGNGVERTAFTDLYRHQPAYALRAAMQMSVALTMAHDSVYGAP